MNFYEHFSMSKFANSEDLALAIAKDWETLRQRNAELKVIERNWIALSAAVQVPLLETVEQLAAQAAQIDAAREALEVCKPLADYGRPGTRDVDQAEFQKYLIRALSLLSDPAAALAEHDARVRADEREACAKVCEGMQYCNPQPHHYAAAIRARGAK